jgi:hypothetical protein
LKGGITMNFCKECDEYISLFIDELLDDETKSHCSAKFEEALFCAELCKEEQDIPLPENFSETLHIRLQQVSESSSEKSIIRNTQERILSIIKNKRLIASLSTAAVLVISLLAYNLMPSMVTKDSSTANYSETAQMERSKIAEDTDSLDDFAANSEEEQNIQDHVSSESNTSGANGTEEVASGVLSDKTDIKITFSEPSTAYKTENNITDDKLNMRSFEVEDRVDTDMGSKNVLQNNDEPQYSISSINPDTEEYISNYSEIKVEVSAERSEIEQLKLLMNDIGASELHILSDNNVVRDSNTIYAEIPDKESSNPSINEVSPNFAPSLEYVDYYLTINQYNLLETRAEKYHLEFNSKTDIIKKDISTIYNEINKKIEDIDKKISNISNKKEDVMAYQAEKERLTEELNKIISEKEMVVVRIFFVY